MSPFISAHFPLKGVFPSYISYTLIPPDCLCCTTVLLPSPSLRDGLRSTGSRVLISCYSMWARNSIIPPFQIACFLALKERLHTQSASCKKRPLTHTHTHPCYSLPCTLSHANTHTKLSRHYISNNLLVWRQKEMKSFMRHSTYYYWEKTQKWWVDSAHSSTSTGFVYSAS